MNNEINNNTIVEEVQDNAIYETMDRAAFEEYFSQNREINYKGFELGIMEWPTGGYDVLIPANNENGYEVLNSERYTAACDAVHFAVNYLVEHENEIDTGNTEEVKKTTKKSKKKKKEEEPKYEGPRTVKVFGREIFIEEDSNATNEDIRLKLVNDYGMHNFKPEKTLFDFDFSTGTLEVGLKFQTKG